MTTTFLTELKERYESGTSQLVDEFALLEFDPADTGAFDETGVRVLRLPDELMQLRIEIDADTESDPCDKCVAEIERIRSALELLVAGIRDKHTCWPAEPFDPTYREDQREGERRIWFVHYFRDGHYIGTSEKVFDNRRQRDEFISHARNEDLDITAIYEEATVAYSAAPTLPRSQTPQDVFNETKADKRKEAETAADEEEDTASHQPHPDDYCNTLENAGVLAEMLENYNEAGKAFEIVKVPGGYDLRPKADDFTVHIDTRMGAETLTNQWKSEVGRIAWYFDAIGDW